MSVYKLQTLFLVATLFAAFAGKQPLVAQNFTCFAKQTAGVGVANRIEIGQGLQKQNGIIQLRGHVEIPGGASSDVWGYFDEVNQREYALIGGLDSIGVSIVDVTDPANAQIVAQIENVPGFDVKAWGVYPFAPSGIIYVSDIQNGLYLFELQDIANSVADRDRQQPGAFALLKNYPNPFNPETRISYQLQDRALIRLNIYNAIGQKIRSLVNEEKAAGVLRNHLGR